MSAGYSPYLECVTHVSKPYPYWFRWSPTPSHRSPIFLPRLCRLSTLELRLPLPDHMSLRLSLSLPCLAFVLNWNCKSQFFFFFFCFPAHLLSGLGFSFTALGPLIMLYIFCFEDVEKSTDLLKSLLVGTLFGWSCIWGFTQCISVFYFMQSVFVSVWLFVFVPSTLFIIVNMLYLFLMKYLLPIKEKESWLEWPIDFGAY